MQKQDTQPARDHAALSSIDDLAARIRELEAELARAERLATLGTLAGAIAHEFNNILTPVMSYAQLALNDPEDRELVLKALRKAVDGTEKAAHIASSVLGFIRDDETDPVTHVAAAVQDTLACLAREPEKDGIELVTDIPTDCWVAMQPVALQQVLLNLILNAREALRPGGGRIDVRCQCSTWNTLGRMPPKGKSPTADVVVITVADTGGGIPPEVMSRLFQPFVRARRPSGERRGTGLGLTICKRLVGEAGGLIEASTEHGRGTVFTITLPRTNPAAAGQKAA